MKRVFFRRDTLKLEFVYYDLTDRKTTMLSNAFSAFGKKTSCTCFVELVPHAISQLRIGAATLQVDPLKTATNCCSGIYNHGSGNNEPSKTLERQPVSVNWSVRGRLDIATHREDSWNDGPKLCEAPRWSLTNNDALYHALVAS